MPDVTIEIDIEECAPFDAENGGVPVALNFYGADVEVLAEVSAVATWSGADPYEAHNNGIVAISHVTVNGALFEGQRLGVDGVAAVQFALDRRYTDRDVVVWALDRYIRDEVVNVVEWQLREQWEHLLGVAV